MLPKIDLSGQRFGRLTVLKDSGKRQCGSVIWECICDCGQKTFSRANDLRAGNTRSCGCYCRELNRELMIGNKRALKNRHSRRKKFKLYVTWKNMKARCSNPNVPFFKYYGGKGVSVCPEWKNDYLAFKNWASANGYEKGLTIDRIDNDGNYEPSNCQFITQSENSSKAHETKNNAPG